MDRDGRLWCGRPSSPQGLFGVADEKPILIVAIDTEEKVRAAASSIVPMVKGGLVLLQDAELLNEDGQQDRS